MDNTIAAYKQKSGLTARQLGEELVLLDLANSSYLGFNSTATFLWSRMREPQTASQLCHAAVAEFEVDEARCRSDIDSLLGILLASNLIEAA